MVVNLSEDSGGGSLLAWCGVCRNNKLDAHTSHSPPTGFLPHRNGSWSYSAIIIAKCREHVENLYFSEGTLPNMPFEQPAELPRASAQACQHQRSRKVLLPDILIIFLSISDFIPTLIIPSLLFFPGKSPILFVGPYR